MTSAKPSTSMLECVGRAVSNCSIVKHLTKKNKQGVQNV